MMLFFSPGIVSQQPCVWGEAKQNDPACYSLQYAGPYPNCSLFQSKEKRPIPCQGKYHAKIPCQDTMPGYHANACASLCLLKTPQAFAA